MDRTILTNLPQGVEKSLVARVLDKCDIVSEQQLVKFTDFLDPYHREFVLPLAKNYFGIRTLEFGGYYGAEYKSIAVFPDYLRPEDIEFPIVLLAVSLSDREVLLSHRDYLGAFLAMGIQRNCIGDIIPFTGGAQVFVTEMVKDALLILAKVGRYKAAMTEIPPYMVKASQDPIRSITTTVASLRLDAVLGAGLGMSRGKVVDLIKADKIKVNWRQISQPAFQLKAGDVLSIRGKGRVELAETGGETKKGRIRVSLKKFN